LIGYIYKFGALEIKTKLKTADILRIYAVWQIYRYKTSITGFSKLQNCIYVGVITGFSKAKSVVIF